MPCPKRPGEQRCQFVGLCMIVTLSPLRGPHQDAAMQPADADLLDGFSDAADADLLGGLSDATDDDAPPFLAEGRRRAAPDQLRSSLQPVQRGSVLDNLRQVGPCIKQRQNLEEQLERHQVAAGKQAERLAQVSSAGEISRIYDGLERI